MQSNTEAMNAQELADMEDMRAWVRGHYTPEAVHEYDTVSGKLKLLQEILNAGWIDESETLKLQCLGITFGDAISQQLGLNWVMVEDEYGRDPALTLEGTSILLFPKTMISKRIEDGEEVDVQELFALITAKVMEIRHEQAN
ncbi:DUF3806 domain-containing protein [Uliginosibacterium gangwonense]|uniref:DUF3806 domain-containing protein n=1 Tax=Uliginosibacterium gangwonense TaxID=392736 RepID=UPI00037C3A0D|nr:DUF3806 domain-containing protein [Uliginosibacterium gangwonense]